MLTIFTTPKPFHGHVGTIQRNAIRSWTLLRPACQVMLFGDEDGTADVAASLRLRHVPRVDRNEFGMPRVKSVFEQAQAADTAFLCYANADIMFMDDLTQALCRLAAVHDRFLMIGQRYNADIRELLDFGGPWQQDLRRRVIDAGIRLAQGIDYFLYPSGFWSEIPDALVVGRAGWDNWPLYEARMQRAPVVDATPVVMAVHQDHDYSHHPDGRRGVYHGAEAERNFKAVGGVANVLTIQDATHILDEGGLRVRCRSCYPMCVCKPASF